jgi:hypothetical protein
MSTTAIIDLQKFGGLKQKANANQNTDKDYLGSQLGWTYAMALDRFPNYVGRLTAEGWTNAEVLLMNYFTCLYNEGQLRAPTTQYTSRWMKIPPGKWWATSNLMTGQGTIQGSGSAWNFGHGGGCQMVLDPVNYKSFVPNLPDGRAQRHVFTSWGYLLGASSAYSHHLKLLDLAVEGDKGDFCNTSIYSCGILLEAPGECAIVENVQANNFNDYGVCLSRLAAPGRVRHLSTFFNGRGGLGVLEQTLGDIQVDGISGDVNPYLIDCPDGAELLITAPKLEARGEFNSFGVPGKGQMLLRVGNYFHVVIIGGQCYAHDDIQIDSVIRVDAPINNSLIKVLATNIMGSGGGGNNPSYVHIVHDTDQNRKWELGGVNLTRLTTDINWRNNSGGATKTCKDQDNATLTFISATEDTRQPFREAGAPAWNHNAPPFFGYDVIDGSTYP